MCKLAGQGKLQEALDTLLNMEKQHRLAEDYTATAACCTAILEITFNSGDWKLLNENLLVLSKRRSQLRQVIIGVITSMALSAASTHNVLSLS